MKEILNKKDMACKDFVRSYFARMGQLLASLNAGEIENAINILDNARIAKKHIFFAGNGGSAATAIHFANDLGSIATINPRFKAISLVDNISNVTAIANDYGYEHIFSKQLERLFEKGDVLVAISASGNSPNIVNAINFANKNGGRTIGFVGFDGGAVRKIANSVIYLSTEKGEYGPVEDMHLMLDHVITAYFAENSGII